MSSKSDTLMLRLLSVSVDGVVVDAHSLSSREPKEDALSLRIKSFKDDVLPLRMKFRCPQSSSGMGETDESSWLRRLIIKAMDGDLSISF